MNNTCEELIKKIEALPRYDMNTVDRGCGYEMTEDEDGEYILRDVVLYILAKHTNPRLIG